MNRIIKALTVLILGLACVAASATSTTISGSNIYYPIGFPLASGQFCFNGACATITNGAFSGTFTEGTATVTITSTGGTQTFLSIPSVTISAATYNWNTYVLAAGVTGVTGLGTPTVPCAVGALYTQNDSIPPYQPWIGQTVGSGCTWIAYAPPLNQQPSGHYAGLNAPYFVCTAPCDYVQTNAVPGTAAWWIVVAAKGIASSNWQLQSSSIAGGPVFTVTSGCGSTGAVSGGTLGGAFTAGQTACAPVIAPGFTAPHGFFCNAHDLTTSADSLVQTASSTTTCTLSGTVVSADVIAVQMTAY